MATWIVVSPRIIAQDEVQRRVMARYIPDWNDGVWAQWEQDGEVMRVYCIGRVSRRGFTSWLMVRLLDLPPHDVWADIERRAEPWQPEEQG